MKKIIFILFFFCVILINETLSQTNTKDGISFSGLIGFGSSMQDNKLRDIPIFEINGGLMNFGNYSVRAAIEFFQSNHEYNAEYFEYKGINYTAKYHQRWSDISIGVEILSKVTRYSTLGIGLSMEDIIINREYPTAILPFRVNPANDEVLYFSDKHEMNMIRFGLSGIALFEPEIDWTVKPYLQAKWKLIYVGTKYSEHAAGTQDMFSISLGIKYNF